MDMVFDYSRDKTINISKTLIGSCSSHTMHRFVGKLKKHCAFANNNCKSLAIFSFTLLHNCVDLNAFDSVLKLILIVFLSKRNTIEYKKAHETLLKLISERPKLDKKIEELIDDELKANQRAQSNENKSETNTKDDSITKKKEAKQAEEKNAKKIIKERSPYTKHFKILENSIRTYLNDDISF